MERGLPHPTAMHETKPTAAFSALRCLFRQGDEVQHRWLCVTAFYSTTIQSLPICHQRIEPVPKYQQQNYKVFPYVLEILSYAREWKYFFFPSEIIFRNCLIIKAPQKEQGIAVREALLLKGCPSFQESECLCTYLVLPLSYCTNAHESFPFFRPIFFCL